MKPANLTRWLQKGIWAIMDQGLWGFSNFLIYILMARWTSVTGFGAFAVADASYILILAFYNALLVEPMLVFGAGRFRRQFPAYAGLLVHGNSAFSIVSSLGLLTIALFFSISGSALLASAFLGLCVAIPFLLFSWLMRQACYVRRKPHVAAAGSGLYILAACTGAYLLSQAGWLSAFSIFCVMGASRLASGLLIAYNLRLRWAPLRKSRLARVALKRHWEYGRWAAAACIPTRLPGQVILLVLPIWGGLAASGAFKALTNLVVPVMQVNAALSVLLIPTLSQIRTPGRFFRLTRVMFVLFSTIALGYWLLVGLFGSPIVGWIYDGRYVEYAGLLWILGVGPVFAAGKEVLGASLRAREQPRWIFWSYTIAVVLALPCSIALIAMKGLQGAVLGDVLLGLVTLTALFFFYMRLKAPAPAATDTIRLKAATEAVGAPQQM